MATKARKTTIAADELAQFEALADDWWNENGKFRPLHRLNPLRLGYIRDRAAAHFGVKSGRGALAALAALDVGCGGGLLCEPLARMGADVTGIDAGAAAIAAARKHAQAAGLEIDYRAMTVEELAAQKKRYDLVCALEIIEHVADPELFVASLAKLVRPGGLLIMSTLNRTARSYLLGIIAAEQILKWVPPGTHDWHKFIKPSELAAMLERSGCKMADVSGVIFDPLRGDFRLTERDLKVNYMMTAIRN